MKCGCYTPPNKKMDGMRQGRISTNSDAEGWQIWVVKVDQGDHNSKKKNDPAEKG